MKHVVCFGELMMRLSPPGDERLLQSPTLQATFGGAEANVAASMAHFGVRSALVTRLPVNPVGEAALRAMRAEGVDVRHVLRGGARLGLYFFERGADIRPLQVVYDRAGSAFSQLDAGELDWPSILRGADRLHLSGITPALGDGPARAAQQAIAAARDAGVPVSFDLNYRPAVWAGRDPVPVIRPLASGCDLLIGNPGAVQAMLGIETEGRMPEPPAALHATARRLTRELGCARVALTQREVLSASEHGWRAFLYEAAGDTLHASRRHQVRVVDRVGGGDSFVAGLLFALLAGRAPAEALEFAAAASAFKLTVPGDFNRATVAEVERMLQTVE